MTAEALARAIGQVLDTDDPPALARLRAELRALGDLEAATVARQAALKQQRHQRAN